MNKCEFCTRSAYRDGHIYCTDDDEKYRYLRCNEALNRMTEVMKEEFRYRNTQTVNRNYLYDDRREKK